VDRIGGNRLTPGQDYRRGVAVSTFQCSYCHSGGVQTRIVVVTESSDRPRRFERKVGFTRFSRSFE